jgi:prophage tail gpP-like protein
MAETVQLKLNGLVFDGWTSIGLRLSLNALCASFDLALTERWPGQPEKREIAEGMACEITVGGQLFLTGWIDRCRRSASTRNRSISVSGRDKTADLIDCSAINKPGSWKGQKIEKIAADLIKPFGIKLRVNADTGAALQSFALEHGEDVFSALTRMCRMRGVMLDTDLDATLVIFTPSTKRSGIVFEEGRNIKSWDFDASYDQRFSDYLTKGQHRGGDYTDAKSAARPSGSAKDAGVTRYRPLMLISDEQSTLAGLKARAAWEATSRLARSQVLTIEVKGWRDEDGNLYRPNQIAHVTIPTDGIDRDVMIADVDMTLSEDDGFLTRLTLVRPEAFTPEADLEPKSKKKKKTGDSDWSDNPGFGG